MTGQIWWFAHPNAIDPGDIIRDLDNRGLTYRQPGSTTDDTMTYITADGSRHEGTMSEVVGRFTSELVTSILWLDGTTPVPFGPQEVLHRWSFDLNGLAWADAQRVAFAVVACASGTPGTLGVVADRQLPDRHAEWARCFDERREIPYDPDFVLLASTAGRSSHALVVPQESWLVRPPR